jgi:hypothetical protein
MIDATQNRRIGHILLHCLLSSMSPPSNVARSTGGSVLEGLPAWRVHLRGAQPNGEIGLGLASIPSDPDGLKWGRQLVSPKTLEFDQRFRYYKHGCMKEEAGDGFCD